ncbi:MAG: hypothetical protein L3K02_00475 [Thermoplasmata archaeon]|nr:hypothetical protein [Thermoplasmata archaeon]
MRSDERPPTPWSSQRPRLAKGVALISVGVVILMLLPGGPIGLQPATSAGVSGISTSPMPALSNLPVAQSPATGDIGPAPTPFSSHSSTPNATISVVNISKAKHIPFPFWGVNVAAQQGFSTADASNVAATPINFIRYPGGIVGEEFNYTSGVITNIDGSTVKAGTPTSTFVTSCNSIHCQAIFQLPAEIDQPQTAAYYADYVVNTLHFQPNYWEIGNSVPGWTHFGTPWSQWGTKGGNTITAVLFAQLVGKYITAIKAVDPHAHFIALGVAMGTPDYAKTYVSEVAAVDGPNLSGVSVHSYTMGAAPSNPTWPELLANLNGKYSLTNQVAADRSYLQASCPKCNLKLFVSEANGAEVNDYTKLLSTFAGDLYVAADVTMGLNLRLKNIDWFCYDCHYGGAWELSTNHFQTQYTLFTQMMTDLGRDTLGSTVTGPSSFYATATYGITSGLALLMVNTNMTRKVSVDLTQTGILPLSIGNLRQWVNGSVGPTNSSVLIGSTLTLPALSISILTVGPQGLGGGGVPARTVHAAHDRDRPSAAPSSPSRTPPANGAPVRTGPTCPLPLPTSWVPNVPPAGPRAAAVDSKPPQGST